MSLGNVHLTPQLVQAVRDAVDIVSIASEHTRLRKAGPALPGALPASTRRRRPRSASIRCRGSSTASAAAPAATPSSSTCSPPATTSRRPSSRWRCATASPCRAARRRASRAASRSRTSRGRSRRRPSFFADQLRKSPFALQYLEKRRIPARADRALRPRLRAGRLPEPDPAPCHPRIPKADLEAAGLIAKLRAQRRSLRPLPPPADVPHPQRRRPAGGLRRPHPGGRQGQVRQHQRDRPLPQGDCSSTASTSPSGRSARPAGRSSCEGYFDVIGTVACGLEGAVAGMGTALTPEQAKLLARYAEEVVVAYDGDSAGENAFRRALPLLLAEGLAVRRARFPGTHDPDSLRLEAGRGGGARGDRGGRGRGRSPSSTALIPAGAAREPQLQAKAATAVGRAAAADPGRHPALQLRAALAADRLGIPVEMLARRVGGGGGRGGRAGVAGAARPRRGPPARRRRRPPAGAQPGGAGARPAPADRRRRAAIPPREELPPPEVFFDTECRNIYEAFCALYAGAGTPPDCQRVRSQAGGRRGNSCPVGENYGRKGGCVRKNRASGVPRQFDRPLAAAAAARKCTERSAKRSARGIDALLTRLLEEKRPFEPQPASGVPARSEPWAG